jgi:hypothetical protein
VPAVLGDLRVDQFAKVGFEALVRTLLIRAHQTRITGDIGCQDSGERRVWVMSSLPQPSACPTGKARDARGCANVWHSAPPRSLRSAIA